MRQKRIFIEGIVLVTIGLVLCSCASVSTIKAPNGRVLTDFNQAYIEQLPNDEFQIYQALLFELSDIGITVVAVPFKSPTSTDLQVKYSFDSGWDLTRYLQAFQFQFIEALSGKLVASTSFRARGLWLGVRDERLKEAFNDLRAKNGLPPTKQFGP